MEEFEQYVATYSEKIHDTDESLKIYESIHVAQDEDHIVVFSIDAPTGASFGVTFTMTSPKKAKLRIEFDNAEAYWSPDHINLFASFICELANCGLQLDEAKSIVDNMQKSEHCKINREAYITWDDYHSTLYYAETFHIS